MCTQPVILDSTLRSPKAMEFEEALRSKIVSQGEALQAMVNLYQVLSAGLNPPGRPVGSFLFLGNKSMVEQELLRINQRPNDVFIGRFVVLGLGDVRGSQGRFLGERTAGIKLQVQPLDFLRMRVGLIGCEPGRTAARCR